MSILKQVIAEYGNSETLKGLTDKTDKRASVGSVSKWLEDFENNLEGVAQEEVPVVMEMIAIAKMRLSGSVPPHYTGQTTCKHCGPVPIFEGAGPYVNGCPWCFNRHSGLPIPTIKRRVR